MEQEGVKIEKTSSKESAERKAGIKRFSKEQRQTLEEEGYIIYELTGKSILDLRKQGRRFWTTWSMTDYSKFENIPSIKSEVAINPNRFFLPKSGGKTSAQHEKMVDQFSKEIQGKFGAKAIIGANSDYAELAFLHLDKVGESLFEEENNRESLFYLTRAKVGKKGVAFVGHFSGSELRIDYYRAGAGKNVVFVALLIVP